MSLETIQLPPILLQELFKNNLIELNEYQTSVQIDGDEKPAVLGNFKKGVLILVKYEDVLYLPEKEFAFLTNILSACKLSMDDIGILNIQINAIADFQSLIKKLPCNIILMFGISSTEIGVPMLIPNYQVQTYNEHTFLSALTLATLEQDVAEKKKLWTSLQKLFNQ